VSVELIREAHPRLYHPPDDPDYHFVPPLDEGRKRILANILIDCKAFSRRRPWKRIPEVPNSCHPFHQLYITFYSSMQATALIENYVFAWRITGEERWFRHARKWLLAACQWEHGDRIEEHFYTANRYMHAFAFALDLMGDRLGTDEVERVTSSLVGMMERWWPEVERSRHSAEGGHHAVVDNGHFGVAALYLLGKHRKAPMWVDAVIDRFRAGIMPHGCGADGEPLDGPSFWPWENMWMLQFADALRNATGVDLYAEFPRRLSLPLRWFRYHLVGDESALGGGMRPVWAPALLRLSQERGDRELRAIALGDEELGRIYRFKAGVKGSSAECMIAYGPSAYLFFDPNFGKGRQIRQLPLSHKFTSRSGKSGILRSSWTARSLVVETAGYNGGVASGFSDLQVCWNGHSLLRAIPCEEAQPLACGSLPCVGGQNEVVALVKELKRNRQGEMLRVESPRLDQEYWLLHGETPLLLVALRRKKRGIGWKEGFVRLDGRDYLQFPREPYFDPSAGELRMRLRLREETDGERDQILWNTGIGVPGSMGTQVNNFSLGFFGGKGLVFAVQSQRYTRVEVRIPPKEGKVKPGVWHEVIVVWGGFNDPYGKPFIEIELDGVRRRCDDQTLFGELEKDSQNLRSRTDPRTFFIHPNTVLGFGAAVQIPGTGTRCDIAGIRLACPGKRILELDLEVGSVEEMGSGSLVWKLNPVDLRGVRRGKVGLGGGRQIVEAVAVFPSGLRFSAEEVPFAPSGLAAGSLVNLGSEPDLSGTRVLADAGEEDCMVLAFARRSAGVTVTRQYGGFLLKTKNGNFEFDIEPEGKEILIRR
jgi:hypothetical protein